MKPTSDGSVTINDEQESRFPTEDDELAGTVEEHTCIANKDKVAASYQAVLKIIEEHQWKVFTWEKSKVEIFVDAFTAQYIKAVYDAISNDGKANMERLIKLGPNNFEKLVHAVMEVHK